MTTASRGLVIGLMHLDSFEQLFITGLRENIKAFGDSTHQLHGGLSVLYISLRIQYSYLMPLSI